jgi:hypothetical protein
VAVASGGVGLPDLDQRIADGARILVEHATGHDHALAKRLGRVSCGQVRFLRRDVTVTEKRASDFGNRLWRRDQRLRRRALCGRFVRGIEIFGLSGPVRTPVRRRVCHSDGLGSPKRDRHRRRELFIMIFSSRFSM